VPVPLSTERFAIREINEVPVRFTITPGEVESLILVSDAGAASPSFASFVPEVNRHRPLVCGLQIQNFDDDDRQGMIGTGFIIVGTLGCFVQLDSNNKRAILSNNHVLAGENRGILTKDRILQPGSGVHQASDQIAVLSNFVDLKDSPHGAMPIHGNVAFNDIDAAIAELDSGINWSQGYLSSRTLSSPSATAIAQLGDNVFKVGRTTGLTYGEVTDIATTVGPVGYDPGPCWFQNSIVIESTDGTLFSDKGDSGSVIVRTSGEVVGLLYAGNGQQTYACPIDSVMGALNCSLA
jgi:hypothetical protein